VETARGIAILLFLVGLALLFLSHLWLLARTFEQGMWCGLGALFFPIVALLAMLTFRDKLKRAFVAQFISLAIIVVGYLSGV
jgi:positive regulator of sigma E activity